MGKRRQKSGKEGELANFPEESNPQLLSPRYLAIATSLVLVFSAFASLLVEEDITGQATSLALTKWREMGITDNWEAFSEQKDFYTRTPKGNIRLGPEYRCPKPNPLPPPSKYVSTMNENNCFNVALDANKIEAYCRYLQEVNGYLLKTWIKCTF